MPLIAALSFRAWVDESGLSAEEHCLCFNFAADRVAAALEWLLGLELPPDTPIGHIGGGHLYHAIFNMDRAPLRFKHARAIELYLNKACAFFSVLVAIFGQYRHNRRCPGARGTEGQG
jgi:hypothetical protein